MDEGQWQSEGPVRRGGPGDPEPQNEVGSAHSPEQNQNRLLEEGEEVEQGPGGGQTLLHQDNSGRDEDEDEGSREEDEEEEEEMDGNSEACSPELDGHIRDSPSLSPSPTVCEGPLSSEEIPAGAAFSQQDLPPSLAASLQVLEEQGDHALLPHCLHQIAEALVLEGDYARAVCFLQLQRLYHERVLSNLTALQEQWESRWRLVGQCQSSSSVGSAAPPRCDMYTEQLEKLRHICWTHRQPTQSTERCELTTRVLRNNVRGSSGTCSAERVMEEQDSQDSVSPKQYGYIPLSQQGEPEPLHMSSPRLPIYPLLATHSSAVTDIPSASGGGGEEGIESVAAPQAAALDLPIEPSSQSLEENQSPGELREPAGPMEAEQEPGDTGREWQKGEDMAPPTSLEELDMVEEAETLGLEASREEQEKLSLEAPEENPEDELEEEGQGVEALELGKATTLDDLARRIQVEEITPAAGLVSILKRRGSLESTTAPTVQKPGTRRKVRFRVPDDGLDHDEVGGDSWLLLLLLCLATVVISVGGTALYCTFGDAKSSVCTDFSHNVDFYMGQVQRGVDQLRHWFRPGGS